MSGSVSQAKPAPAVGQLWFDKDHRVTSRYVRVVDIALDGVFVRRGVHGTGRLSRIAPPNLHRRFLFVDEATR